MTQPSVSVILVSWNTRDLLDRCLQSLHPQIEETGGEVWVVDNASSDGSADMTSTRHPWVRLVRNDANVGFARACNLVIPRIQADFLFFFNPDATMDPGGLRTLLRIISQDPRLGALMPQLLDRDGNPTHFVGRAPRLLALRMRVLRSIVWRLSGNSRVQALWENAVGEYLSASAKTGVYERDMLEGAALFVRRKALEQAGPFDPGFFCGWEETDLTRRLRRFGWKLAVTPNASARHWDQQSRLQWHGRPWEIADGSYFVRKHKGRWGLLRHELAERRRLRYHRRAGAPVESLLVERQRVFQALWNDSRHPGYGDWSPDAPPESALP